METKFWNPFKPHRSLFLKQFRSTFTSVAHLLFQLIIPLRSFIGLSSNQIRFPSGTRMSKVHPIPKKRNISIRYDVASAYSQATTLTNRQKKLRRLPHIFAKVLEFPFCSSSADVSVHDSPNSLRFTVAAGIGSDVRAQTVEICPGVVKVVVLGDEDVSVEDGLEIDVWRFRLPDCTLPEMATADCVNGVLVVVVPKGEDAVYDDDGGNWRDGNGRLVIVQ